MEQLLLDLTARIAKLERAAEALRATEQRGLRACRVTHSVGQNYAAGLASPIAFNTEVFDFGDLHDNVTNNSRITVPTDYGGYWIVAANVRIASLGGLFATDYYELYLLKNGTSIAQLTVPRNQAGGGSTTGLSLATIIDAAPADYFQAQFLNGAAATSTVVSLSSLSPFFLAVRIQT